MNLLEQRMLRKKKNQSVDEFMAQFPKTDNKSKSLANFIYTCKDHDDDQKKR